MTDYFRQDRFAALLGLELRDAGDGYAKVLMPVTEHLRNGFGTVHGGAIFALADTAFAQACNGGDQLGVALEVDISYVRPGLSGTLVAEAREVTRNRRIGIYDVRVSDENGELLALFKGTAFFKERSPRQQAHPKPAGS